jgi:hypothetical protein
MDRAVTRRQRGNAVLGVLLLLLLVALALGGNYVRNYQTDQKQEKKARPYARYGVKDLELLAEGYRAEIAKTEARHGGGRVRIQDRHHFDDQVREFERVQRAARSNREQAGEIALLQADLQKVEAELSRRAGEASGASVHFERMFRF